MRTTLDIADDVLRAVKERARREKKSAGQVISDLARAALTASPRPNSRRAKKALYGLRPFPKAGRIVTNDLIDKLREEDAY